MNLRQIYQGTEPGWLTRLRALSQTINKPAITDGVMKRWCRSGCSHHQGLRCRRLCSRHRRLMNPDRWLRILKLERQVIDV